MWYLFCVSDWFWSLMTYATCWCNKDIYKKKYSMDILFNTFPLKLKYVLIIKILSTKLSICQMLLYKYKYKYLYRGALPWKILNNLWIQKTQTTITELTENLLILNCLIPSTCCAPLLESDSILCQTDFHKTLCIPDNSGLSQKWPNAKVNLSQTQTLCSKNKLTKRICLWNIASNKVSPHSPL